MLGRNYTWFVKPLDAKTNDSIALYIPAEDFGEYEVDEEKVKMWRCKRETVRQFNASRKSHTLKFEIYVQEGNGQIRKWKIREREKAAKHKKAS